MIKLLNFKVLYYFMALLLLAAASFFAVDSQVKRHMEGHMVPDGQPLMDFSLVDFDGKPFSKADLMGKWSLVYFGFAHCPDVCSPTLAYLNQELKLVSEDQKNLQVVFISVDPENDDPTTLKAFVTGFNPGFKGVTGSFAELQKIAKQFGAYFGKEQSLKDEPGHGKIAHSPFVFLVDPSGVWQAYYKPPFEEHIVAKDVSGVLAGRVSPNDKGKKLGLF